MFVALYRVAELTEAVPAAVSWTIAEKAIAIRKPLSRPGGILILVTLNMTAQPQKRTELLEALQGMLEPTRVERGCLSYSLYESVEDGNILLLVEEWKTQVDLDRHIRTDGQKRLLSLMDLLSKPPQWQFNTVLNTAGMELIKKVLASPG